jgi:hypothetical protein
MTNCTGEYVQYPDAETCRQVCARLPEGTDGDTKVNTVGCRTRQARAAAIEPFTHCKFAGPGANGECGSNCEAFCGLMQTICTEATSEYFYANEADCLDDCSGLLDLGDYSAADDLKYFEGDHVQCRLFHVGASVLEPGYHCEHSIGGTPCVTRDR